MIIGMISFSRIIRFVKFLAEQLRHIFYLPNPNYDSWPPPISRWFRPLLASCMGSYPEAPKPATLFSTCNLHLCGPLLSLTNKLVMVHTSSSNQAAFHASTLLRVMTQHNVESGHVVYPPPVMGRVPSVYKRSTGSN
jgi:hypothetical protein